MRKIVSVVLGVLLIVALVAFILALNHYSQGFENWNLNDWFWTDESIKNTVVNLLRR